VSLADATEWSLPVVATRRRRAPPEGNTMTKSITAKFGAPTIGKQRKSKQPKSTRVVKALPRKGVLIEFIGASPSKEWLTKGTKLACVAARARVIEVFQRLTTLKPAALGAEERTPEELPFLRFEAGPKRASTRGGGTSSRPCAPRRTTRSSFRTWRSIAR